MLCTPANDLHGINVAPSLPELRGQTGFRPPAPAKQVLISWRIIVKTFSSIGDFFTRIFGWGGRSSGPKRGPKAGDGAVVHHSSGEADFDGLSGDVPPPVKDADRDLPYPAKKSAD